MVTHDPLHMETNIPETFPDPIATGIDKCTAPRLQEYLSQTFLDNLDPVIKILHRPSLSAFLLEGKPYLDYPPSHLVPEILKCAVYYAAAYSISQENWPSVFGPIRGSVIARYQWETEAALRRADYINTDR